MRKLSLISIWQAKRKQFTHINSHFHNYHELVYYSSGGGETEIGGKTFNFSKGHFAIIPPETDHSEIHHADSEVICLMFSGIDDLPTGYFKDTSHKISKVLNEILTEVNQQFSDYEEMLVLKLNELVLNISRIVNDINPTKSFEYIINYLRTNFHERINLCECAKQLNISYDYFQHKFKTLTGLSPQQFLMEQRLTAAKQLLKKGNLNCTEIALRCGFCTSAQFSALFKKKYGITPLQYKKA